MNEDNDPVALSIRAWAHLLEIAPSTLSRRLVALKYRRRVKLFKFREVAKVMSDEHPQMRRNS